MDENLKALIRENLVSRRSNQFQWLADLVRLPSEIQAEGGVAGGPGDMGEISELTLNALKDLELGIERHTVTPETGEQAAEITNLVVRHEFAAGPVMALVAHGDTRPCDNKKAWSTDPFGGEIRNGALYGHGVLSKADLTVYAHALAALRDARPDLSGTVELHFTFDGEADGVWGSKWLLDNSVINPDYALGSGISYGIGTSSTGDLQLRVEIECLTSGAGAGSGEGADPMEAASRVMDALYELRRTYPGIQSDVPGIGSPSLVIGSIKGGERPDAAPGRVEFSMDRRLLPDEDPVEVEKNLTALIAEEASRTPGTVCRINQIKLRRPMRPGPGTDKLAGVLERQATAIMGAGVPVYGVPFGAATRHYAAVGIPSVLYGAGPESMQQGPDESLVLDDLRKATEVVALALCDFMTPAG